MCSARQNCKVTLNLGLCEMFFAHAILGNYWLIQHLLPWSANTLALGAMLTKYFASMRMHIYAVAIAALCSWN